MHGKNWSPSPILSGKLFEKTGCLITTDGSQDEKIRPQGLDAYTVPFNVQSGHFKSSLENGQDMNYVWCTRENILYIFQWEFIVNLQKTLTTLEYIFIDEYSTLGQVTLGWIDRHCRQATGQNKQLFGGKSIILIGDPA